MQLESTIMLADWFGDAIYGVNAHLLAMPLPAGYPRPPQIETIAHPFNNAKASAFEMPSNTPALYVHPMGVVSAEGEVSTVHRDGNVSLVVRYITTLSNLDTSTASALLTMKAVELSIRDFLNSIAGESARVLNDVALLYCEGFSYFPWREQVGDGAAVASFIAAFRVRDNRP